MIDELFRFVIRELANMDDRNLLQDISFDQMDQHCLADFRIEKTLVFLVPYVELEKVMGKPAVDHRMDRKCPFPKQHVAVAQDFLKLEKNRERPIPEKAILRMLAGCQLMPPVLEEKYPILK